MVLAAVVPAAAAGGAAPAYADETHRGSHNAPRVALIHTGQIDDPLEDVLEHASFSHVVND
ncbi:hypothetical protein [Streptomyces sp. JJ36]|uniref:hypothetical protein n=1 Tax=Streptomyces sp. JJ36 TaxID=2736645 RepID=UPI001F457875|nr:hypothetical protein [Streptomyces sp. JJ36]MCF6523582.1 hypothetical protein [Streptomyces sp. JJ36]